MIESGNRFFKLIFDPDSNFDSAFCWVEVTVRTIEKKMKIKIAAIYFGDNMPHSILESQHPPERLQGIMRQGYKCVT